MDEDDPRAPVDRPVPDPDDIVGQTIDGRYQVLSRIGAGGMGFVFEARHAQLGQTLVLKTLRPELLSSATITERFVREAQSATRIRHPHVIDVKDFGVHPRFGAYYVMERLDGRDLQALTEAEGPVPAARAIRILTQVAGALGAAHRVGVIHRDLKPANVFLVAQGAEPDFVKVLDFGLAKVMGANRRLTETGQVLGTPRYMAPEQCAGERVDARADVYSAGMLLWQLLTGQEPYAEMGTYEILGQKMFEEMRAPSALEPPVRVPSRVEALLMRCLSKDPAARPADGAALHAELEHLARDPRDAPPTPPGGSVAPPSAPSPPVPSPSAPPPRASSAPPPPPRSRGLIAGATSIALVLAAAGVALYLALRPAPDRSPPPTPPTVGPAARLASPSPPDPRPADPPPADPPAAPRPAPAVIAVRSDPPGAEVRTGDRVLGVTPLDIRVPGDVPEGATVRIALEGYAPREITILRGVPSAHVQLHPAH